jgi:CDP-diglyceride synthetase
MNLLDRLCAGTLFVLAIMDCLLVPRTYTGRIWLFGTSLALLFTAMLNVLRMRNSPGVKGLKLFCITANIAMLVFGIVLISSIGKSRTLQHPQVPLVGTLLLVETAFSLAKRTRPPAARKESWR